jgi:HKD family nuclease
MSRDSCERCRELRHPIVFPWCSTPLVPLHTTLIIGSQNLTTTSLLENRELSLSLDTAIAPGVVAAVDSTFDADYAAASPL